MTRRDDPVSHPFAWLHLRTFLRRRGWVFVLAALAAAVGVYHHRTERHRDLEKQRSEARARIFVAEEIRAPETWDAKKLDGVPPSVAIDDAGELIAIHGKGLVTETTNNQTLVWNHKTKAAVLAYNGTILPHPVFCETTRQIIFGYEINPARKSVFSHLGMLTRNRGGSVTLLFFHDAESGELKREIEVPGIFRPTDVSPDGRWIAASKFTGLDGLWHAKWIDFEIAEGEKWELALIDTEMGEVHRPGIRSSRAFFDDEGNVIAVRQDGILLLHKDQWDAPPELILEADSPSLMQAGTYISSQYSWLSAQQPRRYFFLMRDYVLLRAQRSVLHAIELEPPYKVTEWMEVPNNMQGHVLMLPTMKGIMNGENLFVEAIAPAPYERLTPDARIYHQVTLPETTWAIKNIDDKQIATIHKAGTEMPVFINRDTLAWPENDVWIFRTLDEIIAGENPQ